jgi:hypothetical protein
MSKKALLDVMPHLQSCGDNFDKHANREFMWHSDIVISKCLKQWVDLDCWDKGVEEVIPYSHNIFKQYHHYPGAVVVYDSVTFHPLKSFRSMVDYSDEKQRQEANQH